MGGEGSGGPRHAKAGATYSNRSDMTGDAGKTVGDGVNQAAVRTSTPNTVAPPSAPAPPPPGSFGPLIGPSSREGEPVTAGLSLGPGEGPRPGGTTHDPSLWELRALAERFPDNTDLLKVIARAEREL